MDMDMSGLLDRAQNWIERKTSGLFGQAPVIPRTERNMNPLAVNLKNNKRRIYWDGERVIQNDRQLRNETSPMSQFRNEAMGMRAGVRNFKTQVGRAMQANQSMTDLMHTYHGTTKQRAHSKNYARHILKKIGNNADPDQVLVSSIDFNNPDTMYNIVQGIASWEGGPKASFDENLVKYGIDLERPEAAGDFSAWQFGGENAPEQTVQQAYEGMAVANELFNQQLGQDVKPPLENQQLVLGKYTGEVTDEGGVGKGRKLYSNNFGGASSEYSIGVKHPEINNGQMTHIPSIYGGRIRSEKYAIDQIIKNKGKDPETGRFITPGGDPNARSKGITYSQAPLASKPNNKTGFNYQAPAYGTALTPVNGKKIPTKKARPDMTLRKSMPQNVPASMFGLKLK